MTPKTKDEITIEIDGKRVTLYSPERFATMVGITRRTVYNNLVKYKARKIGGLWFIPESVIKSFIE